MMNNVMHQHQRAAMLRPVTSPLETQDASLREVVLAELKVSSLPRRRVSAGTLIMRPEMATESLYFVMDGRIRLYRLAPTGVTQNTPADFADAVEALYKRLRQEGKT